jgi:hypothetical protein
MVFLIGVQSEKSIERFRFNLFVHPERRLCVLHTFCHSKYAETTGFINRGLAVDGRKVVELVNFGESGEFGEWS